MKLRDRFILWLKPKSDLVIQTKETHRAMLDMNYELGVKDGRLRLRDSKGRFIK